MAAGALTAVVEVGSEEPSRVVVSRTRSPATLIAVATSRMNRAG